MQVSGPTSRSREYVLGDIFQVLLHQLEVFQDDTPVFGRSAVSFAPVVVFVVIELALDVLSFFHADLLDLLTLVTMTETSVLFPATLGTIFPERRGWTTEDVF